MISSTGIQSTAPQRGSVYTLPISYLYSFRNGTRRQWHRGPGSGPSHSSFFLCYSTWGRKATGLPCQELSVHASAWTVLQETPGVLPCTEHQPAPGPKTSSSLCQDPEPAAAPPQLQSQLLVTTVKVQLLGTSPATSPDPKGFTFHFD